MKIKTEQNLSCDEMEITIKYSKKDKLLKRIMDFLQSFDMQKNVMLTIRIFGYTG